MGTYLTDDQITQVCEELSIAYSLPYAHDLVGTVWEQVLTAVKGGVWTQKRDNRPNPDFYVQQGEQRIGYSVKTEGLRPTKQRSRAADFLGRHEDFIIARPKADTFLQPGETIQNISADMLGSYVLRYYNEEIVARYHWNVLSFLLRVGSTEFIYWEETPATIYHPKDYWWIDSGRAEGANRNIAGYPLSIDRDQKSLPRGKFRWTSGGKQFYILYTIPQDADIWTIEKIDLDMADILKALREKLRAKKLMNGQNLAT